LLCTNKKLSYANSKNTPHYKKHPPHDGMPLCVQGHQQQNNHIIPGIAIGGQMVTG